MKTKLLATALALFIAAVAHAQTFGAGYTFTYYFSSLTLSYPQTSVYQNFFSLNSFGGSGTPATSTVQWELFDSSPVGTPVAAGVWQPGQNAVAFTPNGLWQDGEGAFRITILSGSQQIDNFFIHVFAPFDPVAGSTPLLFATVQPAPVPEPSTFAFLVFGTVVCAGLSRVRRRII